MRGAVSSARRRSLSTRITLAPSRANSTAAARPLPMVSPGVCPAPTTMPTLSCNLTAAASRLAPGAGQVVVERNAEAVQRPANKVVLTDGEDRVHHLFGRVFRRQRRPGGFGNHGILKQIVGRLQQRRFICIPAGPGSLLDPVDLRLGNAPALGDFHV